MNNKNSNVPSSSLLFSSVLAGLLVFGSAFATESVLVEGTLTPADGVSMKQTQFPKVARDLVNLQDNFATFQGTIVKGTKGDPFTPQVKLMRTSNGYVVIDAIASGDASALASDLAGMGAVNISTHRSMVSARVPITALKSLNGLDNLRFARPFYATTHVGATDSQGDVAQASDLLRTGSAVDGTGLIVGVLSDSYDCLNGAAAGVLSGDLPAGVNVLQDEAGCNSGSDEGRGMLEIVYDVAPGAGLAFHTAFGGQAGFATGITELRMVANADVIVDDVFYFAEPMFEDGGIAIAADAAFAAGVPYFSSAGNSAVDSYDAQYTDSGLLGPEGGQTHDFDPGAAVDNLQSMFIPSGAGFTMTFQWNQPFASLGGAGATSDLDIYIVGADRQTLLAVGGSFNTGGDAVEVFSFNNDGSFDLDGIPGPDSTFYVLIEHFSGPKPDEIKYSFSGSGISITGFPTDSGTSFGHSAAAGAVSVAAAHYEDTPAFFSDPPLLEGFSSRANVPIHFDGAGNQISPPQLRLKPEITAPDGANTTFFGSPDTDFPADGFPNFFGTSAAAPHAAGVAALLLEVDPTLTPTEVYLALENTAIDMETPGFDFDSGFGLIQADDAAAALANNPPTLDPIASQAASTGDAAMVFALTATDPDADSISFSQTGMPGFCALTDDGDGTGDITCTVTGGDSGRHAIAVVATDDGTPARANSQGFYVIANPNSAPVLAVVGDQAMDDGEILNIALSATDPDGDGLSLVAPALPPFCTPTDNGNGTGSVDCTPDFNNNGAYVIAIAAVDDGVPILNDGETITLTVNNVNRDPVLNPIGPQNVDEGASLVVNISANELDVPDSVTIGAAGQPPFCTPVDNLNGTATLTCNPGFSDAGGYPITMTVTDTFGGTDDEIFTLTVNNINTAPTVDFIGNRAIDNNAVLVIPVSSSDFEGDTITLSDSNLPGFCAPISDNGDGTGSITCTPGGANNGTYNNLTATATDTGALSDSESFTLLVGNPGTVNIAPVLAPIGPQVVDDNAQLVIPLSVSDVDVADSHAFSATGLPAFCGAVVDNNNGTGSITCDPMVGDAGDYPVTVRVDDDGTPVLSDTELFTITVIHVNLVPVADAGPDQDSLVGAGGLVNLDGSGSSDSDGVITYNWGFQSIPFGSVLTNAAITNAASVAASFTPDLDGVYLLELTVTDNDSATDKDTVRIVVDTSRVLYFIDRLNNRLSVRDKASGENITTVAMSLAGQTVSGGSGLAVHPHTNEMFAALVLNADVTNRQLVTINPLTGVATDIGSMGDNVRGLTFDSFGTLYAVTGDQAPPCNPPNTITPETLFVVDQATGAMTFEQTLGNGTCGDTIAYNPDDLTLYHASGFGDQVFETINLDTDTTTNIPFSGNPITVFLVKGFVYDISQDLFLGTMFNNDSGDLEWFSITSGGLLTTLATPDGGGNFAWDDMAFWDPNFQAPPRQVNDYDGDRQSDIFWRNSTSGRNVIHRMSGANIIDNQTVGSVPVAEWSVSGSGDYNGDKKTDVLWRNSSGRSVAHLMDGSTIASNPTIGTIPDPLWQIVANGDFDGDGNSDLYWRNMSSGRNVLHLMNGGTIVQNLSISTIPDQDWQVHGSGDFNGDHKADILWRNSATNRYVIHMMVGAIVVDNPTIGYISPTLWEIAAIADFNGDGKSDIFWRNTSTGRNVLHLMDGDTIIGNSTVGTIPDQLWRVVGNGDYNGDGNADILWRYTTSGRNVIHFMDGPTIIQNTEIGTIPAVWQSVGPN